MSVKPVSAKGQQTGNTSNVKIYRPPKLHGNVLEHAQGAFFAAIIVGQIAGLLVCKTRWLFINTQGMRNTFILFRIGIEMLLVSWLT